MFKTFRSGGGEMNCRKCGDNRIRGPKYNEALDSLDYLCLCCGYVWHAATEEQKQLQYHGFKIDKIIYDEYNEFKKGKNENRD